MIVWMLGIVRSLCTTIVLGTIVGLGVSWAVFHFQGRTFEDVKREFLTDFETYLQVQKYKVPATLSGKLNCFEKNYGRYMETAKDYCGLLVRCKKLNTLRNRKKLEAELKKHGVKEWMNNELKKTLILMEKIEENQKEIQKEILSILEE